MGEGGSRGGGLQQRPGREVAYEVGSLEVEEQLNPADSPPPTEVDTVNSEPQGSAAWEMK